MDMARAQLTVFFEDPFWVGVFERRSDRQLEAARVVFGAEPKDYEVYRLLLERYFTLRFSPALAADACSETGANPKRMQREASRLLARTGTGTKAQQALALQREAGALARKEHSRQERDAEADRKFHLRQERRKQRHRGR